jgi:hypothetical protein
MGVVGDTTILSIKKNINLLIKTEGNTNHIKFFKNGKMLYEWTDYIKEDNSLIREIGKTTILWKDNEIIWSKILRKTKPIKMKKLSSDLTESFLTMDLETIRIFNYRGETLSPYLLNWYDGEKGKGERSLISTHKQGIMLVYLVEVNLVYLVSIILKDT